MRKTFVVGWLAGGTSRILRLEEGDMDAVRARDEDEIRSVRVRPVLADPRTVH